MLLGLLTTLFSFLCIFTMLLILVQKSKSSLGMGNIGSGNQMLFGGSGGQSFFQKITWFFGALLMLGSLGLTVLRAKQFEAKPAYLNTLTQNSRK